MPTRRDFLKTVIVGGGAGWLGTTLFGEAVWAAGTEARVAREAPILIVLQLSGGNDGLNTVIPLGNDYYSKARGKLALPFATCHALTAAAGLHPALSGIKSLYEEGNVAVVQGVGYPHPNRSHFRSMEIWHTAADASQIRSHGWLGRYFDCNCTEQDASVGITIGGQMPQAFAAAVPKGLTFSTPDQLRVRGQSMDRMDDEEGGEEMTDAESAGGSIGMLAGGSAGGGAQQSPLAFIERTDRDAHNGAERIEAVLGKTSNASNYPDTALGRDLALTARLIAGGMPTRVYYLSIGGFDTHTQQAAAHERLLKVVGDGLKAFVADLRQQGLYDRTAILTFSEFGRRVKANASGGTDHGAAGPVFVLGGRVTGGVLGQSPTLEPESLDRGDVPFQVDFRSLYATLLEQHLRVPSTPILGRQFSPMAGLMRGV